MRLTFEMVSMSIWEIMNSEDMVHRQHTRGMWRGMKSRNVSMVREEGRLMTSTYYGVPVHFGPSFSP